MRRLLFIGVLGMLAVMAFGSTALAIAGVAYDSIRSPLPPNVPSLGFQATQTAEFGDDVQLAVSNPYISSVTVTMSSWAKHSDWVATYPSNAGFDHPITLNIYNVDTSNPNPALGSLISTTTQTATIPWRPEHDASCPGDAWLAPDAACYNGFAFNLTFNLTPQVHTSQRIIIGIAYNTQSWGATPTGISGPYNSLNVGLNDVSGPTVGTDSESNALFWNTSTASNYSDGGAGGTNTFRRDTNWAPFVPMFQVTAESGCTTACYVDAATGNDANSGASLATAKKTIQAAINTVLPSGSVFVNDGTYNESPNITKSLTLQSLNGRNVTTIALQTGPTYLGALTVGGSNVTVDGFTIIGRDGVLGTLGATNILLNTGLNDIVIKNNKIEVGTVASDTNGDDGFGILSTFETTPANFVHSLNVHDNLFVPLTSSGRRAYYINPGVTAFTFEDNAITGNFERTATTEASSAVIRDNTLTGNGSSSGFGAEGFQNPDTFGQATFTGNQISAVANGISVFEANNTAINHNVISSSGTAVRVLNDGVLTGTFDPTSVHVNRNSLAVGAGNNGITADAGFSASVDGTCNWWGSSTGPGPVATGTGSKVSSHVGYIPWLTSSNLDGACDGTPQAISLLPTSQNFGDQNVGTMSAPATFTVQNIGDAPLTISNVQLAGTNPSQFGIDTNNCDAAVLAPNATCTILVVFSPTSTGAKSARLDVSSNDPDHPIVSSTLSGNGTTAAAPSGTVTIVLDSHPNNPQPFTFTGSDGIGAFTLTDDGVVTPSRHFVLAPHVYVFKVKPVARWALSSLTCNLPESILRSHGRVLIDLAAGQNVICTFTESYRAPDALISTTSGGSYLGDNIYSNSVIPSQTLNQTMARGETRSFFLQVQNDGVDNDTFKIFSTLRSTSRYRVTFWVGNVDVTVRVKAGTYSVNLAAGASTMVEVRVTARRAAPAGAIAMVDLTAKSKTAPAAQDVVRLELVRS